VPTIRTEVVDQGVALDPTGFDLLCVTSTNSAPLLLDRLRAGGRDVRALAGLTIAAIGPGTAKALAEIGIEADIVPQRSITEALVEALAASENTFKKAMVVRAEEARDVLSESLRAAGTEVTVVPLYRTVREDLSEAERAALGTADTVTFTSASTVRNLLESCGGVEGLVNADGNRPRLASIGPITTAELNAHGLTPDIEASQHDVPGLVDALIADAEA
jgi:uroporphyrinogen III methyltransferase/synthase